MRDSAGIHTRSLAIFVLYINDLCNVTSFFHFVLFADDTNIISSHKGFNTLLHKTNEELSKVVDLFDSNKLVINHVKTCIWYFSKPNIKFPPHTIKVKINDICLNVSLREISWSFIGQSTSFSICTY